MAEAYKSANTQVWVGAGTSDSGAPYIVPLAAGEERYIRSADLSGTTAIDKVPTFGGEDVEAIVNQQGVDVSTNLLYGEGPKMLTARQDRKDNKLAIIFTDSESGYVIPVTWTGQPYENPTSALITVAMEFLSNGVATDAGQVGGNKTRVKKFTEKAGGAAETGFMSLSAGDRLWAVISKHEGTAQNLTIEDGSSVALSAAVSISAAGIYEIPALASDSYTDLMAFNYGGGASDKITGWFVAGPDMTIDGG